MLERIAATIARHRMFEPGQRVGVAVSGGADSVCLLHVLDQLAPRWALKLSVLHVNHQLRGEESDRDQEFVRELAARFGLSFECRRAEVRRISEESRDNLEQAARRVRREFFLGFLRTGKLDRVALGHTRSDQAETVLLRFLRGAGTAGLAAMRPATPEGFVRPLLETDRAEVESFLRERGISWREDSSNLDRSFDRNRVRHDLLPALMRDWNPALPAVLAGVARVAADEDDYWKPLVEKELSSNTSMRSGAVVFRAEWLAGLGRALARRVARRAVEYVRGDLRGIDLRHIEGILEAAALPSGSGRFQAPGLDVFRSFDWLRLARPVSGENRNYAVELAVPGSFEVPHTGLVLGLELIDNPGGKHPDPKLGGSGYNREERQDLDWGRISGTLVLRNWRPGDRYRPIGHANAINIKTLFQDARIPIWERRNWPVIWSGDNIVWAGRFGANAEFAASPQSSAVLRVYELEQTADFCNPDSES